MRTSHAMLGIAAGAALGAAAGFTVSNGGFAGGSPFAALLRVIGRDTSPSRAEALKAELQGIEQRTAEIDSLRGEVRDLQGRLEGVDGAQAFAEAKRLGIVDEVAQMRPELRASAVRRMSVAIVVEARRHSLDPLLLAAVARVESGYNPFATSDHGARGLLQLTTPTGRALLEQEGESLGTVAELYDIETNVALGARYLAHLVKRFDSVSGALLAYNRGPDNARAALRSPDRGRALAGYPKIVLAERDRLAVRAAKKKGSGGVSL